MAKVKDSFSESACEGRQCIRKVMRALMVPPAALLSALWERAGLIIYTQTLCPNCNSSNIEFLPPSIAYQKRRYTCLDCGYTSPEQIRQVVN